jgi:endonuclease/exonuclease/phosphatase family metal-dependent hydrolase
MKRKFVSINIEGRKHLESVAKFLQQEQADIVCLMEVAKDDVLKLSGTDYPFVVFAPNDVVGNVMENNDLTPCGVAIMSKTVMIDVEKNYPGEQPRKVTVEPKTASHAPVLLFASTEGMRIGAIHFTWSKKGEVSQMQKDHLANLQRYLAGVGEFVLFGDFNIPRGNELYKELSSTYQDNIPLEVKSTLDSSLHYANKGKQDKLQLVVDYAWSTPGYEVSDVRVVDGVSDHCAIVCYISLV